MTTALIAGREIHVDEEGFMTDPAEWNEEMAAVLAKNIGIDELTPDHWKVIRYLREDLAAQGETPTLRRVSLNIGITTKQGGPATQSGRFYAAAVEAVGLRVEREHLHERSAWEAYWRPMLRVAQEAKTSQPADILFADEVESGVELERRAVEAFLDYATFVARRP